MKSMIPGYKTFKAIKFGIGIAWMISLMRVVRSVIVVGGLAALGFIAYRYFTKQQVNVPAELV
jgi:hypothetical protein